MNCLYEDLTEPLPQSPGTEIFDVVQSGEVAYGVAPFENSSHGPVMFTLDCLADRRGAYGSIHVCGEIYLDVHHFLLGRRGQPAGGGADDDPALLSPGTSTPTPSQPDPQRPRARPLSDLRHVRRVYSHPQAFGQTGAFLSTYLRGVDAVDVSSTSRAAELAARDESGASAAIAGEIAAEANGLDVLARCIEDHENNTTRFFVVQRGVGPGPPLPDKLTWGDESAGSGRRPEVPEAGGSEVQQPPRYRSLVSFTVPTRSPGALADVLDCFRRFQLDLTSINSLPSLIQPFQYLFFVEFEGSKLADPDGRVNGALEDVAKVAHSWRWLGSWSNQRK